MAKYPTRWEPTSLDRLDLVAPAYDLVHQLQQPEQSIVSTSNPIQPPYRTPWRAGFLHDRHRSLEFRAFFDGSTDNNNVHLTIFRTVRLLSQSSVFVSLMPQITR